MKKILLLFFVFLLFSSAYVEAKDDALKKIRPRHVVNAIIEGDLTKLQNYIDKGVDINGAYFGSQFISYAISTHQDDVLDFLLENGADPNPENEMSLLYYAIMEKNQYALARLLKAGADPNKTFMGDTPKNLARTHKNKIFIEIYENYEQNPDTFMPNKYKEKVFIATKAPKKQEITKNQINGETKSISTDKIQNADLKQIQEDRYDFDIKAIFSVEKKDPKLITITKTKPVNNKIYSTKVANDGLIYKKNKNQLSEEYYNLYVILDKLLRANNLQYQNWRVGIALNPEEINATASAANFITINSSLYDSFYQNKDALSFVIAHELSHLVLGHAQKTLENRLRIAELERQILQATNEAEAQRTLGNINAALGNSYASIGNSVASLANSVSASMLESELNDLYQQRRQLEIQADTEALVMMTRAGYNPTQAIEVLNFLSSLPHVSFNNSSHPSSGARLQNIREELFLNDIEELVAQGQNAVVKSNVSTVKQSSDKKTIVLAKAQNSKKGDYIAETKHQKLLKKAYTQYLCNSYEDAQYLFSLSYTINPNNYIPALYLSYINEYNYKQTRQKNLLKQSKRWLEKAEDLNRDDAHVVKQKDDLFNLYQAVKLEKKKLKAQRKAEKQAQKQQKEEKE